MWTLARRLLLPFLLLAPLAVFAADARVAVASNFLVPVRALVEAFEAATGYTVSVSSGSTGKLYAQIVNGAPFDVFLAANAREPERLVADGEAVAESRFTYARGRLAVWAGGAELGDARARLCAGDDQRLAIANPATAPYGAAAMQALNAMGCAAATRGQLVRGENISQTYQFVATRNVALGFVALSQLRDAAAESFWVVPDVLHDPIAQQAVLLTRAVENPAAVAFHAYLRGPAGARLIREFGYASAGRDDR